jgi:hypothetical protein
MKSIADHKKFWKQIYADDQEYRGKLSNDSIDCLNLIKCCIYLNKFGYPERDILGKESQIISYVWIHNKYPETDFLTFPIIMEGFRTKQIEEENFKNYYLRSIYKNKYYDHNYKEKSITELLKKLKLRISKPIDINEVIKTFQKEQQFLKQSHIEIGIWNGQTKYDTLYLNDKPIINDVTNSPIRIFKSSNDYYYHRLYEDKSHYPQMLIEIPNKNYMYKLDENDKSYLQIEEDGSLKFVNEDGSIEKYSTENNR